MLLAYELLCSFKGLLYPLQTMPEYVDFISSQEAILLLSKLLGIATIYGWLIIEERVASTLYSTLKTSFYSSYKYRYQVGIIILILQVRTGKLREVKSFAQGHTVEFRIYT